MSTFLKILRIITLVMPVYDAISERVRKRRERQKNEKIKKELQAAKSELAGEKRSGELWRSYKHRPVQEPYGGDDE